MSMAEHTSIQAPRLRDLYRWLVLVVTPVVGLLLLSAEGPLWLQVPMAATSVALVLALHYAAHPAAASDGRASPVTFLLARAHAWANRPRPFWLGVLALLAGYLAVSVVLIVRRRWNINPDAFSYLQMARDYAAGEFVVRGYWSPLVSWLTAPLIRLGVPPEIGMRLVIILGGLACIGLGMALARRLRLDYVFQLAVGVQIAALTLSVRVITADVIGAAVLLAYLLALTWPGAERAPLRFGLVTGLAAGAAYLARSFNLPFSLAHLPLYLAFFWPRPNPAGSRLRFAAAFLVGLGLVASPWVWLLSQRYQRPTFSTSALHTRGLVAPGADGSNVTVCFQGERLCPEPADVLFPWEDHPVEIQPNYDWSPLDSVEHFQHQIRLIAANVVYVVNLHPAWSILALWTVLGAVLLWSQAHYRRALPFLLVAAGLYVGGYLLTLTAGGIRYFIAPYSLLFLAFGLTFQSLFVLKRDGRVLVLLTAGALLVGLALIPALSPRAEVVRSVLTADQPPRACEAEDAPAAAPHLVAPFAVVGIGGRTGTAIAYWTQIRTVGYLDPARLSPAAIHAQVLEAGAQSVILPAALETAPTLVQQFGYQPVANSMFCGADLQILSPPAPGTALP